jgi:hypothetical protein
MSESATRTARGTVTCPFEQVATTVVHAPSGQLNGTLIEGYRLDDGTGLLDNGTELFAFNAMMLTHIVTPSTSKKIHR